MAKTIRGLQGEIKRVRKQAQKREKLLKQAKKLKEQLIQERTRLASAARRYREACDDRDVWGL